MADFGFSDEEMKKRVQQIIKLKKELVKKPQLIMKPEYYFVDLFTTNDMSKIGLPPEIDNDFKNDASGITFGVRTNLAIHTMLLTGNFSDRQVSEAAGKLSPIYDKHDCEQMVKNIKSLKNFKLDMKEYQKNNSMGLT